MRAKATTRSLDDSRPLSQQHTYDWVWTSTLSSREKSKRSRPLVNLATLQSRREFRRQQEMVDANPSVELHHLRVNYFMSGTSAPKRCFNKRGVEADRFGRRKGEARQWGCLGIARLARANRLVDKLSRKRLHSEPRAMIADVNVPSDPHAAPHDL